MSDSPRLAPSVRRATALVGASAACLAAACASSPRQSEPDDVRVQGQQSTRVVTPGVTTSTVLETRSPTEDFVRRATLAAPPDRAWQAVTLAYEDLKIPVTLRVDAQRQIGSQGRRVRSSLGGTRLGLLFACGSAAGGGDAADSYELTLDLTTTVAPSADGTQSALLSVASALAKPTMTSGDPVRCVSTGRLEQKVAEAAAKRLGS